jgi:hypothetical protein
MVESSQSSLPISKSKGLIYFDLADTFDWSFFSDIVRFDATCRPECEAVAKDLRIVHASFILTTQQ